MAHTNQGNYSDAESMYGQPPPYRSATRGNGETSKHSSTKPKRSCFASFLSCLKGWFSKTHSNAERNPISQGLLHQQFQDVLQELRDSQQEVEDLRQDVEDLRQEAKNLKIVNDCLRERVSEWLLKYRQVTTENAHLQDRLLADSKPLLINLYNVFKNGAMFSRELEIRDPTTRGSLHGLAALQDVFPRLAHNPRDIVDMIGNPDKIAMVVTAIVNLKLSECLGTNIIHGCPSTSLARFEELDAALANASARNEQREFQILRSVTANRITKEPGFADWKEQKAAAHTDDIMKAIWPFIHDNARREAKIKLMDVVRNTLNVGVRMATMNGSWSFEFPQHRQPFVSDAMIRHNPTMLYGEITSHGSVRPGLRVLIALSPNIVKRTITRDAVKVETVHKSRVVVSYGRDA